jgi:hypothetical protein
VILISLVGEQPIPNLLAARALKPATVLWACSQRTEPIADRLTALLAPGVCLPDPLLLPAYNAEQARQILESYLDRHFSGADVVLNLTGGTKPMAWAALLLAAARDLPFVYLQTEGQQMLLSRNRVHDGRFHQEARSPLPALISAEDYLHAHDLPEWHLKTGERDPFETMLEPYLHSCCDEVLANLDFDAFEVDFVVRRGNRVGVVECKRGAWRDRNARRAGMDQLVIASEEKFLGTYTARLLVTDRAVSANLDALAQARQIHVLPMASAQRPGFQGLSPADERKLRAALRQALGN